MKKYEAESDVKKAASRIWNKVKQVGKLAAEILDPSSHNIDNPDNKKYYEKDEYWQAREETLKTAKDLPVDRDTKWMDNSR